MTLRQRTLNGVFWNLLQQFSKGGISVLVTLLLAYLLTPEDFGLVAMLALFITVATATMDSGFKQALIRKVNATQTDLSTAFYSNIILGIVAYVILIAIAPFVADFYSEPRLVPLIRVAGLTVIVSSFGTVQIAVLSRSLNFRAQLRATVPASIVSGAAAIGMAYSGFGVWALILQPIIASIVTTAILWVQTHWRPTKEFDRNSFLEMYGFGYKLFLSGLLDTIFKNIYVVVIARVFDATTAGLYFFSHNLKQLAINQLVQAVQTVTFPALSSLQSDNNRLREGYRNILRVTTFIVFPVSLLLAAVMGPLFELFFPERWWAASTYAQLIFIAGLLYPLHTINLNILKVKGRSDLFLYLEIFKKMTLCVVLYFTYQHGVIAIILGQLFQSTLAYIPNSLFSSKLLDYGVSQQLSDVLPSAAISVCVSLPIFYISSLLNSRLVILSPLLFIFGMMIYVLLCKVLNLKAYSMLVEILRERFARSNK